MPFSNEVIGTNGAIIRNWMKSENYIAGISGWQINKNGTAEFNNGIFRGSIEVGPLTGQHFVVNNPTTGDALDVYNSSNQLVFSINAFGIASSRNPTTGLESSLQSGQIQLDNSPGSSNANLVLVPASDIHHQSVLEVLNSPPVGATYTLELLGGSDDGVLPPTLVGNERGVQGSMVQSDQRSTNNLIHVGTYTGTTDASGHLIFSHNCQFTPSGVIVTGRAPNVGTFPNLTFGGDGFTSTLANISFIVANTNAAYANSPVSFDAMFFK